jgi:hypothetical protein
VPQSKMPGAQLRRGRGHPWPRSRSNGAATPQVRHDHGIGRNALWRGVGPLGPLLSEPRPYAHGLDLPRRGLLLAAGLDMGPVLGCLRRLENRMPLASSTIADLSRRSIQCATAAAIAGVIAAELGAPPEALFDRFDPGPFAAASIGQVHRAELDGQALAVKVQYPGIEELLRTDIATVGRLARLATLLSPVDGRDVVEELAARVLEECDYVREADNQNRFAGLLAGDLDLAVPAVRADRSSRRVLPTVLCQGADFDSFAFSLPRFVPGSPRRCRTRRLRGANRGLEIIGCSVERISGKVRGGWGGLASTCRDGV